MGKAMLILVLVLACLSVPTIGAQPAQTGIRCELKPEAVNPKDNAVYWARQYVSSIPTRPGEVKDTPEGLPRDSQYFLLNVAGRKIPMVMASGQDMRKAVLYVDINGDGRLSDEKGFRCSSVRDGPASWNRFGPVALQFGSEEQKVKVELGFMWNGPSLLIAHPINLYKGQFRLGDNAYAVAVIDADLDGTYGKAFSMPEDVGSRPACDFLMIDLNHDGRFPNWTYFQQSELMPLGRFVKLAGAYYEIDVVADGTALELKRVDPEFGTLDLGGADVQLKLWSDAGAQDLTGSEKRWRLPAGTYRTVAVRLNQTDSAGTKWTLANYRETGALRRFQVRAGETTTLKLGPPFQIQIDARRNGRAVSLGLQLEGQAGELYSAAVTKNGVRAAQPKFQIVSEAGKVLRSGQFEYG